MTPDEVKLAFDRSEEAYLAHRPGAFFHPRHDDFGIVLVLSRWAINQRWQSSNGVLTERVKPPKEFFSKP